MAYDVALDAVLSTWTAPARFATFAHVVDKAAESDKGRVATHRV